MCERRPSGVPARGRADPIPPGPARGDILAVVSWRSPHDRDIARLAVPALGALIAEPLYVLGDTAIVGNIGTTELAGLAIASSALLTGYAVFVFLAYGTTAAVARLLGAGRERDAATQAVQSLWLAGAIGVVVAAVVWVLSEPVVRLLGADGPVVGEALVYLRISLLGVPAHLVTFAGTGYLRGLQDTRTPLVVAVTTAVANLVLEIALIEGLGFGIGASAASTVVAQFAGGAVYVTLILRATTALGAGLAPDRRAMRTLARVGTDLLVRTIALRAALTLSTALAARIGVVDVGAHEVAFAIWSFLALGPRRARDRGPGARRPLPRRGRPPGGQVGRQPHAPARRRRRRRRCRHGPRRPSLAPGAVQRRPGGAGADRVPARVRRRASNPSTPSPSCSTAC